MQLIFKAPRRGHRFKNGPYVLVSGGRGKKRWHRPDHPSVIRQVLALVARAQVAGRRYRPAVEELALACGVPNSYVLYRTKLPQRIIEKMVRKGKTFEQLPDYVGYAIVTRDLSQTALVTSRIPTLERSGIQVKRLEPKLHGPAIRAVHADLELDGVNGELQVMPWWVQLWSEWDHDSIYKPPQEYGADLDKLRTYSLSVLLWCFGVQENPRLLPPPCPPEAQRLGLCFPYEKVLNYRYSG